MATQIRDNAYTMVILDRYVLKNYLLALLFTIISFVTIFVIVDMIEDMDKFIDKQVPVSIIILFYVYYLAEIIKLVLPVAVLMAALFSIGQMARHHELTPIKASGISLYRIFLPILIFVIFLSVFSFYFNESVVTLANRKRWEIDRIYLRKLPPSHFTRRNDIYIQDSPLRTVVMGYYEAEKKTGYDVDIIAHTQAALTERIIAKEIHYKDHGWTLVNGMIRTFSGNDEHFALFDENSNIQLNIEPQDLEGVQIRPEEMSYSELETFIAKLHRLGGETRKWRVEKHQKLSFPFSHIIIVLFGLTLASSQWRGGAAAGVGISIFLCFIYYSINISLGPVIGQKGIVPPAIAAWIGNAFFGILALWTFSKTKR